jgi:hypothetical protein
MLRRVIVEIISKRKCALRIAAVVAVLALSALSVEAAHADAAPTLLWQRKPGTVGLDLGTGVAVDTVGDIVLGGWTSGSIGKRNEGDDDAFIIKYSADGMVKWRRQPASAREDRLTGLATDLANNVVAVGRTHGALAGPHGGNYDGFVVKYAADGTHRWRHQIATSDYDSAEAVAADMSGNLIVAGLTGPDALLIKYAPDGTELWRRVLDSADHGSDSAYGVAVDTADNIVVVGYTSGSLGGANKGGFDIIVAAYTADGMLKWVEQPGSAGDDFAYGIEIDPAGRIFVVGQQPGSTDVRRGFLAAFSNDGVELWRVQRGGAYFDWVRGVAIHPTGDVIIAGTAFDKPFAASYTPDGVLKWTRKLPTFFDYKVTPATDAAGHLVLAGTVWRGDRSFDGFLAKYASAP